MRSMHPSRVVALLLFMTFCATPCHAEDAPVPQDFATPEAAADAFDKAPGLTERLLLIRPMAGAYLEAGRFPELSAKLNATPFPQDSQGERLLLQAQLSSDTGDFKAAKQWLAQIPAAARKSPDYFAFAADHPALFPQGPAKFQAVRAALHDIDPHKAFDLITADPGQMLNDPQGWAELTPALANQNLIPRLIPILREGVAKQPENWKLRMLLAEYEIITPGEQNAGVEDYWQVIDLYSKQPDAYPGDAADFDKRGREVWGTNIPLNIYELKQTDPLLAIHTLRKARDIALRYLSSYANSVRDFEAFEKRAGEHLPDANPAERIYMAALMGSFSLVLRETQSYLDSGIRLEAVDQNADRWLNAASFPYDQESPEGKVRKAFADRAKAKDNEPSPYAIFDEAAKTNKPESLERMYALLDKMTVPPHFPADFLALRYFREPEKEVYSNAAAYAIARSFFLSAKSFPKFHALIPSWEWSPVSMSLVARDPDRYYSSTPYSTTPRPGPTFLANAWTSFLFGTPSEVTFYMATPQVYAALDRMAVDPTSPYKGAPARMAKAFYQFYEPAQSDEGLALMKDTVSKSPTDLGHYLLAAMLVDRDDFSGALQQIDAITVQPGYYADFIQKARTLLQHGIAKQPLFDKPVAAQAPAQAHPQDDLRPGELKDLLQQFKTLVDAADQKHDAKAQEQASLIADKILWMFPPERQAPARILSTGYAEFEGRGGFLQQCKKIGKLPDIIQLYEAAAQKYPGNVEAWRSLAEAYNADGSPKAFAAYQQVFGLEQDKTDAAREIVRLNIPGKEKIPYFVLLLENDPAETVRSNYAERLFDVFQNAGESPRFVDALATGLQNPKHGIPGASDIDFIRTTLLKNGEEDAALHILLALSMRPDLKGSFREDDYGGLLDQLHGMLVKAGRIGDAANLVDRRIFLQDSRSYQQKKFSFPRSLNIPWAIQLFESAKSSGTLSVVRNHAQKSAADSPDDLYAHTVLLTILMVGGDPAFSTEAGSYIDLVKKITATAKDAKTPFGQSLGNAGYEAINQLQQLGFYASTIPAFKTASLDMLELAQLQSHDNAAWSLIYARAALDFGDNARARQALTAVLKADEPSLEPDSTTGRSSPNLTWQEAFPLLFRAGMADDAKKYYQLLREYSLRKEHRVSSGLALGYMRAAIDNGNSAAAREVAADFQQSITVEISSKTDEGWDASKESLREMEGTLIKTGLIDEASQILDTIGLSIAASAHPELHDIVKEEHAFLNRLSGKNPPQPAVFFGSLNKDAMTFWWDNGADTSPGISTRAWEMPAPAGGYTLDLMVGKSAQNLQRIASVPMSTRGMWHGSVDLAPEDLRVACAVIMAGGKEVSRGPLIAIGAGENKLADPGFEQTMKGAGNPSPWTVAGTLSKVPGPVPGGNAVELRPNLSHLHTPVEIRGTRIAVSPGESYFQSGWINYGAGKEGVEWGRRYLDAGGKELGVTFCESTARNGWVFVGEQLSFRDPNAVLGKGEKMDLDGLRDRNPGYIQGDFRVDVIPPGTVAIEPVLRASRYDWEKRDSIEWAGLAFSSFVPRPSAINPPVEEGAPQPPPPEIKESPEVFYRPLFDDHVNHLLVAPDSKSIVVSNTNGVVRQLEYPSGKELAKIVVSNHSILALSMLNTAGEIAAVDEKGNVHLLTFWPSPKDSIVYASEPLITAIILPDRKWAVLGGNYYDGVHYRFSPMFVEVVDLETHRKILRSKSEGTLKKFKISPDGSRLEAWQDNMTVVAWKIPSLEPLPVDVSLVPKSGEDWRAAQFFERDGFPTCNDPVRKWKITVFPKLTVQNSETSEKIWSFGAGGGAVEVTTNPADGAILAVGSDGVVRRFVVPGRTLESAMAKP